MKPALVLGLALAANAFSAEQLDNELIIAPTDQYGNIKRIPGHIMYDEADDELLVRPISTHVADDELIVAPRDENGRIKYPNPWIRYDEEGNEFFVAPTHRLGELGHRILYDNELAKYASDIKELLERNMEFKGRLDDEGDDELVMAPYMQRRFDDLSTRKVYDDEADLELMKAPYMKRRYDDIEGRKVYDDEADNEQFVAPRPGEKRLPYVMYDEQVDDELMMAPLDGTGKYNIKRRFDNLTPVQIHLDDELLVSPFRRRFDDVTPVQIHLDEADSELLVTPFRKRFDDGGRLIYDDELLSLKPNAEILRPERPYRPGVMPKLTRPVGPGDFPEFPAVHHPKAPTMGPKLFVNRPHVMTNDDEGDDELVYLGELLKNRKMDRFRDHELPEIKGRKQPVKESGFLPVN